MLNVGDEHCLDPIIAAVSLLAGYTTLAQPLPIRRPAKSVRPACRPRFRDPGMDSNFVRIRMLINKPANRLCRLGDDGSKAKRIKLILDLRYQPGKDLDARRDEFDRLAAAMLTSLGLTPSRALHDAIRTTHQFRQAQPGANIAFDPGRSPFNRQVLIIRDPTIRVVAIPRSP